MANVKWMPLKQLIASGEISYPKTCHHCAKSMYASLDDALKVCKLMASKGTRKAQVYRCKKHPDQGWHLTSNY